MRRACVVGAAVTLAASIAHAGTRSEADAALALACGTCHAMTARDAGLPALHGPAPRLLAELRAFRDGTRAATIMDRITRGYSDEELVRIADFIADPRAVDADGTR